jgi:rifampicin phosphotransferase
LFWVQYIVGFNKGQPFSESNSTVVFHLFGYNEIMFTLPLGSEESTLENSGGKGASLSRLVQMGMPVPPGFIITTTAYNLYVTANNLENRIAASLQRLDSENPSGLEEASACIRQAFSTGKQPEEILQEVSPAFLALKLSASTDPAGSKDGSLLEHASAVSTAVRSSATAEDLPDLSFAGQQDTFLNIIGEGPLLKAVVDCWSSLWTARAIGYRLRNGISNKDLALAVIVQVMVPSDVSGVMFTANPLTGLLSETVIDATFGLGEALVSGKVEPDHFVAGSLDGIIRSLRLGAKETALQGKGSGALESLNINAVGEQTLTMAQIRRLVAAGQQVQKEYGSPQDIEWAYSKDHLYLLQSRPITSLYPLPEISFDPLIVWASFGSIQGLVGPLTPLGQEAIQRVIVGVGRKFGSRTKYEEQNIFAVAGERVWSRVSDMIRNPLGSRLIIGFLGFIEPSVGQILNQLIAETAVGFGKGRLKLRTVLRLLRFFLPVVPPFVGTMLQPGRARQHFIDSMESYLQTIRIPPGRDRFESLANFAAFMASQGSLADALSTLLPRFLPVFAPAMASLNLIDKLLPKDNSAGLGFSMQALEITRGLPHNVTTEMDLKLWETAKAVRDDAAAAETFRQTDASILASLYLQKSLSPPIQFKLDQFFNIYGMRGIGEIDLGQPRWREDPTPVMLVLQSYLDIDPEVAPDVQFGKGAVAAKIAIEQVAGLARRQRGGWFKERLVRSAAERVRLLMGARESPKFTAIRAMGIVRAALLGIGRQFTEAGTIFQPQDLFFLRVIELEALSRQDNRDWKALIALRRRAFERELLRRQVPRVLVSDGRAFYEGLGASTDSESAISGNPVSPGVVKGIVRVVLDPRGARLQPGEILVCPGTDPAWTPLFMAAGGLVMEVGGMMTHGSVVAREYGIPAVVGVHQATLRLHDGQCIQVDGTSGLIKIL